MMRPGLHALWLALAISSPLAIAAETPPRYEPAWESLDRRPTPAWFGEAKFGIFIHWGLYSVPAWCEERGAPIYIGQKSVKNPLWQRLQTPGSPTWEYHRRVYGENFAYKDFASLFKAQLFNPDEWAELFRKSGARYVVLTARFGADAYCLWPAPDSAGWNSVETGPRRDLVGDLTQAVRAKGLRMGLYYGLSEWHHPFSTLYQTNFPRYIETRVQPQLKDMVTRYRPSLIFTDGDWAHTDEQYRSREFLAWLYNESPCRDEVVVNDRWGKKCRHTHGGYWTTEYGAGLADDSHAWEENRTIGRSFSFSRADALDHHLTERQLIHILSDLVSRGGNLLLGIGPRDDGRIPVIQEERLRQMGEWLAVNGEAIYGTRCWRRTSQWSAGARPEVEYGKTFRAKYDIDEIVSPKEPGCARVEAFFTWRDGALYAIVPRWPKGTLELKDVPCSLKTEVTLLGRPEKLSWRRKGRDIVIKAPPLAVDEAPCRHAYVFRLTQVSR